MRMRRKSWTFGQNARARIDDERQNVQGRPPTQAHTDRYTGPNVKGSLVWIHIPSPSGQTEARSDDFETVSPAVKTSIHLHMRGVGEWAISLVVPDPTRTSTQSRPHPRPHLPHSTYVPSSRAKSNARRATFADCYFRQCLSAMHRRHRNRSGPTRWIRIGTQ